MLLSLDMTIYLHLHLVANVSALLTIG